jgi:hypothetical protein
LTAVAWVRRLLIAIAGITVLSGAVQVIWPRLVLHAVGGALSDTSAQCFGTVGMFMVLFGGALAQALLRDPNDSLVIGWATLQKAGAAVAVGIGVTRGVFTPVALLVASFDGATALLGFWYWRKVRP